MSSQSPSLSVLLRKTTIEDHDEVLRACNTTLTESKGDFKALFVKTVALIKQDRHNDALRVLEDGGEQIKAEARFEHAYALYKVGRQEEARKLVHDLRNNRGAKHLEAQAAYRSEDFEQAARLYTELGEEESGFDVEANDLRINAGATDAQLEWRRQGNYARSKKASRLDLEAFETAYNVACASIASGELAQADFLLKRAKDLCGTSDELDEEDKAAELLPIKVQQLYVAILLGKPELAEGTSPEILLEKASDLVTKEIIQANVSAASAKLDNPYMAQRLSSSLTAATSNDTFFAFQTDLITYNQMAMELQMFKFSGVADRTAKLVETFASTLRSSQGSISTANAAAHTQNQLGKVGLKSILPLLERRPNDVGLVITIIHLYILANNHGSAIIVLESFLKRIDKPTIELDQDVRHGPGLIALLVSLYTVEGRRSQVKMELAKATSYWRHKSRRPPALLHATGLCFLASLVNADLQEARQIFKELYAQDPHDRVALAGLVASSAIISPQDIETLAEHLTPIAKLTCSVDMESLERRGIPRTTTESMASLDKKRVGDDLPGQNKKRARKSRLPKQIDSSRKPDPERWFSLRDRSTYRPKGKKGKQKAATLTQGGMIEKAGDASNIPTPDADSKSTGSVLGGVSNIGKKKKSKK